MSHDRRLDWRMVLGFWSIVGVLFIIQSWVVQTDDWGERFARFPDPEQLLGMTSQIFRAWSWALLTPVVFGLRREIGRRHTSRVVIGGLHLLAALSAFVSVNVLRVAAARLCFGYSSLASISLDEIYSVLSIYSFIDFYIYWIVLLVGRLTDLNGQKRQAELREEQIRTQLVKAELAALKQQVHPHFLFNALNSVSALIRDGENPRAIEALARLSQLLRQLMTSAGQTMIELRRELDYAQCYLEIEQVRFEEKLQVRFDAEGDCLGALVPTLILQPLVENAVKHGIAQRRNPGRISVIATRSGDRLCLRVTNDPAEGGRRVHAQDSHGVGLTATRARLEHEFGRRQKLDLAMDGAEGTVVTMELPLHFAPGNRLSA